MDQRATQENSKPFIHLRVHSQYSLLEGALPLGKVLKYAQNDQAPAIAICDTNNLFGALEFAQKASGQGIQPIIACQLSVDFADHNEEASRSNVKKIQTLPALALVAASEVGYANLVRLVSRGYLETNSDENSAGFGAFHIRPQWMEEYCEGLICLTGGPDGVIGRAFRDGHEDVAQKRLEKLNDIYHDRLYMELQRCGDYDRVVEAAQVDLAYQKSIPLVGVNEAFFPTREDYDAHDALMAIAQGSVVAVDDRKRLTPDHYLKSQAEMVNVFSDLPEAIDNTVEIARRCHYYTQTRPPILPRFTGGDLDDAQAIIDAEALELRRQAVEGLKNRIEICGRAPGFDDEEYAKRLDYELGIIENMKFPGYFLIVADFIKWAKMHDIPVGPGRGSGAGSLVAWALTITDIDPLRFSLLFERFLNPERVSMPDFDIDFCQDRREEVIRYVQEKYGREQVAQIITFGSLQARAVLRDVGRVLQMPYGQVDRLCKMVPSNPANPVTLGQAIKDEPKFQEEVDNEPIVGTLLDIAQRLEGLYRHASTHAAGIVIGDRPLSELVPMYRDQRSDMPVTQFNMKWVEQAGLVKFDFLGLKTLTVLQNAVALVKKRGIEVDLATIPLDDKESYAMLARGETVGVFQVESAGMRKALIGMRPDCIEDIIALVALYRPGPMENIPTYNARKHGEEELASIHPMIDHLVKETQGVIVYQEQVMQIAQELSGYSLGEADMLRRAMGKKIRAEMDKQRVRFVDGAQKKGVSKPQANTIFDLLAKFADYGFNKSHAAAYAVVSYQTAYMKAHYPVEFLAASMSLDLNNSDKLNDFRQDAKRLEIEVVPPSVQSSHRLFAVEDGKIFYAFSAIKGVGEAAADHIVEKRGEGKFATLADFCEAVDPKMVGKRVFESLIAAGAFDCFGHPREAMFAGLERMMGLGARAQENAKSGQVDLFGGQSEHVGERLRLPDVEPWEQGAKLQREFQAIGFYLSAHPLDEFRNVLDKMRVQNCVDFTGAVKRGASAGRLAGTVTARQERRTRTGNKMGIINLCDASGSYEAVIFSEGLAHYREFLEVGTSVVIEVGAESRPEGVSFRINRVLSLEEEASRVQKKMRIFLRDCQSLENLSACLKRGGDDEVSIIVIKDDGQSEVEISLPQKYQCTTRIASALRSISGVVQVDLIT